MKKLYYYAKKITAFAVVAVILATMFSVNTFAADTVKINGETFNVGDTITYTATFKCDKICSGITSTVAYDENALELDKESVNVPNLGSLMVSNVETDGLVKFIGLDVVSGFDFTKGNLLISLSFKVKDGATDNDIKLEISDITDIDTNVITADSYSLEEKVTSGTYSGDIVTPGDGNDIIEEDKKNNPNNQNNEKPDKTTVVWIIVAVIVAVGVIGTVVVKVLKNNNSSKTAVKKEKSKATDTEE